MDSSAQCRQPGADNGRMPVLASQSPRRLQLLRQLGFDPVCMPTDIDESPLTDETADQLVVRLARLKAEACLQNPGLSTLRGANDHPIVLAADTVVELDGRILGKPADENQAVAMLQLLSDRTHHVYTGVCINNCIGKAETQLVVTSVKFTTITQELARRYWLSGEPQGKAGSYAIQGLGAQFVESIVGSYSNVVGLPLFETSKLLENVGLNSI